jgi:RsiW-degrading membrane proteinase PrsW (M82 family)
VDPVRLAPDLALATACVAAGAGWAALGAARVPGRRAVSAVRGLLGGVAAFGLAHLAFDVLGAAGLQVRWERLLAGGGAAVVLALLIGLVEEGAKLVGIALAAERPREPGATMSATIGVAAGFGALEALATLRGVEPGIALARAALAPVAHALLSAPLGFAVRRAPAGPRAALALAPALAVATGLHALSNLSLALPRVGPLGYAAALVAPAVWMYLHARLAARGVRRLAPRP